MRTQIRHIIRTALLGILLQAVQATGQEYNFVNRDANYIHSSGESKSFALFAKKWEAVRNGSNKNINIVHIGSSHVQGGTLPHTIRMNLLKNMPGAVGARGMLFPYSAAAKCNNPFDYIVHCAERVDLCRNVYKEHPHGLGLTGISVTAHDSTTRIQMVRNEWEADFLTDEIVLFGFSEEGVEPILELPTDAKEVGITDSAKGDAAVQLRPKWHSEKLRRYYYELHGTVDSFTIVLPCKEGERFTLTGVYLGSSRNGVSYHSIGVNGSTLADYLRCPYLTCDLSMLKPDMVIFGIGINDATSPDFDTAVFYSRYRQLADSVRSVNPQCAIVYITNNDSHRLVGRGKRRHYEVNRNNAAAREVFYRLAETTDGVLWDQFEVMGGEGSMKQWQQSGLAKRDRVHFTVSGYRLIADLFSDALLRAIQAQK